MRVFGVVVCLMALALTGYSAIVYKAPKIQADIRARTEERLANATTAPIDIIVDGRQVTLRGTVGDDGDKEKLLDLAGEVWGGLGPVDELERLTVIAPYRFEATKDKSGRTVIEGFAPDAARRDLMVADARAIFGSNTEIWIELAAGVPDGDWRSLAGLGMDALATLDHGKIVITDKDVSLLGDVASPTDIEAIDIFAEAAPAGVVWTNDLSIVEQTIEPTTPAETTEASEAPQRVEPFTMSVQKNTDGSLAINGFAPDEMTRKAMIDQAKAAASDNPLIADIQIAEGMPNANWPELVFAGIGAMAQVEAGKYDVIGNEVSFTGDVTETPEAEAIGDERVADEGPDDGERAPDSEIEAKAVSDAADQRPAIRPYVMTIYKTDDGGFWVQGAAPDTTVRDQLVAALKQSFGLDDIDVEIELAPGMPDDDWQDFVTDRATALKAVKSGSLSFTDYQTHLIGVVDTPEDIDLVRTRIAAIDNTMTADLNPVDPRPAATLELVASSDKGVTLWGNLPDEMTEKEAVEALGLSKYEGGLSEEGRGNAETWRASLTAIGSYLPQFEHVGIKLSNEESRIEGKLHTKSDVDKVTEGLTKLFPDDQSAVIDVSVTELNYENGTKRTNPLTGKEEVYDRGYWLPIVAFSAGLKECQKQSSEILAANKISFLRGEATLDSRAEKTIDRLASVVNNCLGDTRLTLKIGGHTNSRGAKDMNQTLSQKRAEAVLRSLTTRGVDGTSLIAIGYGEDQPVTENETEEGRAKNRRITFEWKESGAEG